MSKISFGLIPAILIIFLSVFFYLSPKILGQKSAIDKQSINDLINKRFLSLGNSISHATFVVDAVVENDDLKLSEIITTLRQDEPEITLIHFLNAENKIIASSDPNAIGNNSNIVLGKEKIREKSGIYEGTFGITIGSKIIGALYFQARPRVPEIKVSSESNPIILILGIVVAIVTIVIMLLMSRGLEAKLVEEINRRQEEVFLPKIDALKNEQITAQKTLDELNKKITEAQTNLKTIEEQYAAKKREFESSPVVQSVEKLKETEVELLKKLEVLKEEENRLNKEITLLTQKREEIMTALEAEKKEEATLREKLDLIKKKILHLEATG
uniref:Single cache domain-containing protein n=1 Tax=candidate division WOR-3 bacterium TaxID=2052148 RepID=A0A7C4THY6_UNCW3